MVASRACRVLAAVVLVATGMHTWGLAGEVKLTWNMPTNNIDGTPLTDLAGAKVYYGLESGNYTTVIDVGYVSTYTITGLQEGVIYYCNGTAYNTLGLESDFCTEAVKVATASTADPNQAPQVDAGPDNVVTLPASLALNGTVSDDGLPQGSTVTVTWSQTSGPGAAVLADTNAAQTSVTFSEPGQYVLQLEATDGDSTSSDSVAVEVHAPPPPPGPGPGEVRLSWSMPTNNIDGTQLTDLAGAKVYYGLESGNYTTVIDVGYTSNYTITGLQEGVTYYCNGTAYNTLGLESDFCTEAVKVATASTADPNQAPQVYAGPDNAVTLPASLALSGTVSDDGLPQGSTVTVTWSQTSGPGTAVFADANAAQTSVAFSEPGQYVLQLEATDGDRTSSDSVAVEVYEAPPPPGPGPGEVRLSWSMPTNNLDGTPLNDLAGAKVYYGLESGNYTTVVDVGYVSSYTITGLQEGVTYYCNGTAYNTHGVESDFCVEAIKVATAPTQTDNLAPQVDAGPDRSIAFTDALILTASVIDDGLPAGASVATTWSALSGPGFVNFSNPLAFETSITFSRHGQYVLQLHATDGDKSATDQVTIDVASVPGTPSRPRARIASSH